MIFSNKDHCDYCNLYAPECGEQVWPRQCDKCRERIERLMRKKEQAVLGRGSQVQSCVDAIRAA